MNQQSHSIFRLPNFTTSAIPMLKLKAIDAEIIDIPICTELVVNSEEVAFLDIKSTEICSPPLQIVDVVIPVQPSNDPESMQDCYTNKKPTTQPIDVSQCKIPLKTSIIFPILVLLLCIHYKLNGRIFINKASSNGQANGSHRVCTLVLVTLARKLLGTAAILLNLYSIV
ncbi:hypothetical protein Nepgr_033495 [Nepenthes gracilis]|uniref:Uncharacterized protein n=1 Tax=Nepenthes gracilis TaxID=150966 RepID=A0AAD3Y901_NEPGR|nr:hypothetical protein Nepgr_033495 [Nepenthes gracilis]